MVLRVHAHSNAAFFTVFSFTLFQVNYLGLIGGTDVCDCTWRVLRRLFANNLAKQLSWSGVDGKMSLASLQLKDVVIGKNILLDIMYLSDDMFKLC